MFADSYKVQESQTSQCSPAKSHPQDPAEPGFLDLWLVTKPLDGGNFLGISLHIRLYVPKAKNYHHPKPFIFLTVSDSNKATPACEPRGAIFIQSDTHSDTESLPSMCEVPGSVL